MKPTFNTSILTAIAITALIGCAKKKAAPLSVYPNPATTYIVFDATETATYKNGEIEIKDMQGNILKVFKIQDSSRIQWQIDTFQRGVYYFNYTADKMKPQTSKIVFN